MALKGPESHADGSTPLPWAITPGHPRKCALANWADMSHMSELVLGRYGSEIDAGSDHATRQREARQRLT